MCVCLVGYRVFINGSLVASHPSPLEGGAPEEGRGTRGANKEEEEEEEEEEEGGGGGGGGVYILTKHPPPIHI